MENWHNMMACDATALSSSTNKLVKRISYKKKLCTCFRSCHTRNLKSKSQLQFVIIFTNPSWLFRFLREKKRKRQKFKVAIKYHPIYNKFPTNTTRNIKMKTRRCEEKFGAVNAPSWNPANTLPTSSRPSSLLLLMSELWQSARSRSTKQFPRRVMLRS